MVGALGSEAEVVGDEQHRDAEVVGELVEVVEDLLLHRDVERRRRLVGDEQLRSCGQAHGDERALAHAAGELVRILPRTALGIGQTGLLEQLHDATSAALPLATPLATSASLIWEPTFHSGLRFDIGSCGTSPIDEPRSARMASLSALGSRCPSNRI